MNFHPALTEPQHPQPKGRCTQIGIIANEHTHRARLVLIITTHTQWHIQRKRLRLRPSIDASRLHNLP